jgi:D-alanyl-D-alanine carboxypeptidase (penicillin-binding protein 5/6)
MLKSHNDTAVAIAEHIAGSVEEFAVMMNEKAKEIGCTDTHFVTPNGLDASDEGGEHRTTARDLALIMRYAIQNETFVRITQTRTYSFSDLSGKRQYTVQNANALLDMLDGVISGKTGFTGNAGYCYVCACQVDDRVFIVALLGCGWPNNKSYKWSDTRKLLAYGSENFAWQTLYQEPVWNPISVQEGVTEESALGETVSLNGSLTIPEEVKTSRLLVGKDEKIRMKLNLPEALTAPVEEGQEIGSVSFWIVDEQGREQELLASYPILAEQSVERISYYWYVKTVFHSYFH